MRRCTEHRLIRLHIAVVYLQYGPAVCSVRTEPEVPAMWSVASPAVVLALRGVLPRYPRTLTSPGADSLERTWLLESEPIRLKAQGQRTTSKKILCVNIYVYVHITPAVCILYISICIALPLRVRQYTLLLQRNDTRQTNILYATSCYFGLSMTNIFSFWASTLLYGGFYFVVTGWNTSEPLVNHHYYLYTKNNNTWSWHFVCVCVLARHFLSSPLLLCMNPLTPLHMTNELAPHLVVASYWF